MAKKKMEKKEELVIENKEEVKKKDSDLILSRFDTPTYEDREPVVTKTGPNNIFTVVSY